MLIKIARYSHSPHSEDWAAKQSALYGLGHYVYVISHSVCRQVGAHLGVQQVHVVSGLQMDSNPRPSTLACWRNGDLTNWATSCSRNLSVQLKETCELLISNRRSLSSLIACCSWMTHSTIQRFCTVRHIVLNCFLL